MSLLFTRLSPFLGTDDPGRGKARRGVKPADQSWVLTQRRRLAREGDEDLLGDVPGQVRVSSDTPQGGRINEIEMTLHEFREGGFRAVAGILAEEFSVIHGSIIPK
jgi:hypothetical protein